MAVAPSIYDDYTNVSDVDTGQGRSATIGDPSQQEDARWQERYPARDHRTGTILYRFIDQHLTPDGARATASHPGSGPHAATTRDDFTEDPWDRIPTSPEEEIEVYVKMPPKSVRLCKVRIVGRSKAAPKPILSSAGD